MIQCSACGTDNEDDSKFCIECGTVMKLETKALVKAKDVFHTPAIGFDTDLHEHEFVEYARQKVRWSENHERRTIKVQIKEKCVRCEGPERAFRDRTEEVSMDSFMDHSKYYWDGPAVNEHLEGDFMRREREILHRRKRREKLEREEALDIISIERAGFRNTAALLKEDNNLPIGYPKDKPKRIFGVTGANSSIRVGKPAMAEPAELVKIGSDDMMSWKFYLSVIGVGVVLLLLSEVL